jgi:phosphate transport system permease protein
MSRGDRAFVAATGAATGFLLAALLALVGALVGLGVPGLGTALLVGPPSADLSRGGILYAVYGTALVTMLMTLAVVPFGVVAAIHLGEYARPSSRVVRLVRAAVHALAGVPSIVFGLFGLGFFVLFVGRGLDALVLDDHATPVYGRPAVLWAAATLAVLTLPVVIVTTEEALAAVPRELREAAQALGATKLQSIVSVVLPAARAGVLTGAILATSRGAGEVAAILFTGVASYMPHPPTDLRHGFMHLGYHVYVLATQAPDVEGSTPTLLATALVLVVVTVGLNAVALVLRARTGSGS